MKLPVLGPNGFEFRVNIIFDKLRNLFYPAIYLIAGGRKRIHMFRKDVYTKVNTLNSTRICSQNANPIFRTDNMKANISL